MDDKIMNQIIYKISTILYAVVFIIALGFFVYFITLQNWFLVAICLLMMWTCVDNFFCGPRACNAGYYIKTHYAVPPFLKRK